MSKNNLTMSTTERRRQETSIHRTSLPWQRHRPKERNVLALSRTLPIAGALLLWLVHSHTPWLPFPLFSKPAPLIVADCAPLGGHKMVSLPDGSRVDLNTGTCVRGVFTPKQRLLRLEFGEGIFQVAHDPKRPFIVETGRVSIADVGTRFDVFTREEKGTRVAVLEGAIQIYPRGAAARQNVAHLTAGQQMDIPNELSAVSLVRHITPQDMERMTAWLDDIIQLDGQPLGTILAEFARYQPVRFTAVDPSILGLPIGGTFRTTDVDSFVRALKIRCIHGQYDEAHLNITLTRTSECH